MKIVFGILLILVYSNNCQQKHSHVSNFAQDDILINYEASTRGFYEKIWITKDSISFSNDRSLKDVSITTCKKSDWDELIVLLNKTDIKTLPQLESPTKMHQFDGAAMATFSVKMNDETFETNIFDHGHPPKTISALVNKVLSMKEMMSKH